MKNKHTQIHFSKLKTIISKKKPWHFGGSPPHPNISIDDFYFSGTHLAVKHFVPYSFGHFQTLRFLNNSTIHLTASLKFLFLSQPIFFTSKLTKKGLPFICWMLWIPVPNMADLRVSSGFCSALKFGCPNLPRKLKLLRNNGVCLLDLLDRI